ncbi:MAG: phosphotransferase [Mizugakiibacter sp.]|uniref:phosphotransferase n=1 Tax=Mizugakiibacter sp. TaxID=1972610 RepID=UPI0031C714FF|nr:phosphotransferase [Xanthomonadaceae bacterium]
MLDKTDWAHLIPHAGAMVLLDAVLACDATHIHALSEAHLRADHPLRRDGRIHAVHLCEVGAQAMAVHGALLARDRGETAPRPGLLVALRDVVLHVDTLDGIADALDVHAECLLADAGGAQYAFRVEHRGRILAAGRAAVIHPSGGSA